MQEARGREDAVRRELTELQERTRQEIKALQHRLADTEERLKGKALHLFVNTCDVHMF